MIITCNKCSTSFNLDDSLIKDIGSKVRCSACKDTFTVYPEGREPELQAEEPSPIALEDETEDEFSLEQDLGEEASGEEEPDDFEIDEDEFSLEEPDISFDGPALDIDDGSTEADQDSDSLEIEGLGFDDDEPGLEIETSALEMDSPDIEAVPDADEDSPVLGMDAAASEEDTEMAQADDSGLGFDDDFSFDAGELTVEDDTDFDDQEFQDGGLDFEEDGIEFEEIDDDEFDGMEFESIEEDPADTPMGDLSLEMESEDEKSFSMELDQETDDTRPDLALEETGDADRAPAFESEEGFELEFDVEEDADVEGIPEIESELEIEVSHEEPDTSLDLEDTDEEIEGTSEEISPGDDFRDYEETLEEDTEGEPEIEITDEEEEIPEDMEPGIEEPEIAPPPIPKAGRQKKKSGIGTPVLILLLIVLLVAGAWVASLMTGIKIPYLSDIKIPVIEKLIKAPEAPEPALPTLEVDPQYMNGRYVDNATAGQLFIITGRLKNVSGQPVSHTRIRGILSTRTNKKALQKAVYCGNIISEEILKSGNIADINKQLLKKEGSQNANVNIKPKASIHFMVVFSDLPDELQNFAVEVLQ